MDQGMTRNVRSVQSDVLGLGCQPFEEVLAIPRAWHAYKEGVPGLLQPASIGEGRALSGWGNIERQSRCILCLIYDDGTMLCCCGK